MAALTMATLIACAVLVGLGVWQWQRKAWKEELIATLKARLGAAPLPPGRWAALSCPPTREAGLAASCEFTPVRLVGRFDHAGERHVFTSAPRRGGGAGYWVLTPFDLADGTSRRVFVNRGFVPDTAKDPEARPAGQLRGDVEIIGLIRSAEERGTFSARANPEANIWFLRAPRELLTAPGTGGNERTDLARWQRPGPSGLDFYIEQMAPMPPGGLPALRSGPIEIPNRHLEYALTWWGLAAALLGVYAAFLVSRARAGSAGG